MSLVDNHHGVTLLGQVDGEVSVHPERTDRLPFSASQLLSVCRCDTLSYPTRTESTLPRLKRQDMHMLGQMRHAINGPVRVAGLRHVLRSSIKNGNHCFSITNISNVDCFFRVFVLCSSDEYFFHLKEQKLYINYIISMAEYDRWIIIVNHKPFCILDGSMQHVSA